MRRMLLFVVLAGIAGAQTMTEFGAAAAAGTAGGAGGKKVSDGITAIFGKVDQQTKAAAKGDDAKTQTPSAATKASASPAPEPAANAASGPAPNAGNGPAANAGNGPAAGSTPAAKSKPATKTAATAKTATTATKAGPSARLTRTDPPEPPNSVPDPPPIQRAVVSKPAPPPAPKPEIVFAPILPPPPPPPVATVEDLKAIAPGTNREDVLKLGAPASRITMFDDGHVLEIYTYAASNATFGVVRLSDGAVSKVELR